jgi:hypothetical protein
MLSCQEIKTAAGKARQGNFGKSAEYAYYSAVHVTIPFLQF